MKFLKSHRRFSVLMVFSVVGILMTALLLNSCGTDGYDAPPAPPTSETAQTSPLISSETLKSWIDKGFVNGTGVDRVVILDINMAANYDGGHIPGAHFMNNADLYQTRNEGVAATLQMVLDGAKMDALIRKYGIDGSTTIVFTSGNVSRDVNGIRIGGSSPSDRCNPASPGDTRSVRILDVTRAYWTFRYWGFPQARLKVLDGVNCAYEITYGQAGVTKEPTLLPAPSTYSVKNNVAFKSNLRASLSEMISVAEGSVANAVIVDFRSSAADASYAGRRGSTAGVFSGPTVTTPVIAGGDFTVFEGRIKGAKASLWTDLISVTTITATGFFRFKPQNELTAQMTAAGIDNSKPIYAHCRTGRIATSAFFVLDAILGWPSVMYDGSWSQWGQMSADSANGGRLAADSPWRTDTAARSENVVYTYDSTPGPAIFTGTGLNDLTSGGTYTGTANRSFRIQIDGVGAPNTFRWTNNSAATPIVWTTGVAITAGAAQPLSDGIFITFTADTGHTLNDQWDIITRRPVELLTLDGGACTSRLNLDGTITNDPVTCSVPTVPRSSDSSANMVEEEDAAYFGAGGGGGTGGGSGGGPIAPGY